MFATFRLTFFTSPSGVAHSSVSGAGWRESSAPLLIATITNQLILISFPTSSQCSHYILPVKILDVPHRKHSRRQLVAGHTGIGWEGRNASSTLPGLWGPKKHPIYPMVRIRSRHVPHPIRYLHGLPSVLTDTKRRYHVTCCDIEPAILGKSPVLGPCSRCFKRTDLIQLGTWFS